MSWVTVIWSMVASACLTLAAINLLVWSRDRRSWAHLCFSVMVVGVIGLAIAEIGTMKASSPEEFGRVIRWVHLVYAFGIVGSLGFVHFYFGTGRRWLLALAVGLRLLAVVINFTTGLNLQLRAILSLQKVSFLGEQVSVLGDWVPSPWVPLGYLATFVWLVYVIDASVALWRKGSTDSRRRAVIVGGSLVGFGVLTVGQVAMVVTGRLRMPFIVSFPFLGVVLAMTYELSRDVLRAGQLGRDLHESEQRMTLAADAASLGVWIRDLVRNEIWATDRWRALLGFTESEPLEIDKFLDRLHPDDRERVRRALAMAIDGDGVYETEYRVVLANGQTRWIASRGQAEFDGRGKPIRVTGVSIDISNRKLAERELLQRHTELAHLSRVTMLGELSSSLAHELNQPLGAILRNTEAAELFLQDPSPDLEELRAILADIRHDDQRAGAVIDRMRSMLKRREVEHSLLDLNMLAGEVISFVQPDADARKVRVTLAAASSSSSVHGDRVQLQQVLLNLILNAMDAVNGSAPDRCLVTVCVKPLGTQVQVAVSDSGHGIPDDKLARLFEPFFTTKANGIGMGLPISRTIIESHGGSVRAENNQNGGATLYFMLPVAGEEENPL
ncbi:MAG: PAS domain-containing protein [Pyrinomonadaceae bacterium]|nr:PAS domain-containing protein [Pyrinomonadaceae bacterium]